jgi:predicted RND superfamily exporter protein
MGWLLSRGRWPFLALVLAATAFFLLHASRVGIETNNESLTARDAERTAVYERFKATFGNDEDILLAVVHPQLLEPPGIRYLAELEARIARLPGVRRVFSLASAQQILRGAGGAEMAPVAPPFDAPDFAARLRTAIDRNPDFTGLFVSPDRRTAGLLIEIEDRPGDTQYRATLIDALRELIAAGDRDPGVELHVTGIAIQKHDVSALIERDRRTLMPLAVVVLGFVLASFFRSLLGVALPLAVTGITVAWTLGAYQLGGFEVNAITALLPPVLMVLSLGVSVHLIQGWLDAADGSTDRLARIRAVVRRLLFPCFFCTLTTAIGFGSLVTSQMPAVQLFGAFAALGVGIAFAAGMTVVPIGLSFVTPPAAPLQSAQHRMIRAGLAWTARVSIEHPWRIVAIFSAITAVCLAGLPMVRNNTDLVRFLRSDQPLHRDTMFIDAQLGGANTLEFVVSRPDGATLVSPDAIQRMAAFGAAIGAHPEVTSVSDILGVLRQLQRAESGGEALVLPENARDVAYAFDLLQAAPEQSLIRKLVAPDFGAARFNVRVHAVGTAVAAPLADEILAQGREIFGDGYRVDATGAFFHVAQDSNRLVEAQLRSFGSAVVLIFLAIGVLLRSLRLTLISFLPNVMPIAWTLGLMGHLGIDLSTGTAMIASSVIGLVVDDTIHYLAHYQRLYDGDAKAAVRATTAAVGAPLLVNNVVLVLGFWVGCFGSFKPTIYFSLLSGVTMITALVCDLFVTPASLVLLDRGRARAR